MITVTITKRDYDDVVYSAVALDSPETVKELVVCRDVLLKLEALGTEQSERGPDGMGGMVEVDTYKMNELTGELALENAEGEYLRDRLIEVLARLQARRTRHLLPLLAALEKPDSKDTKTDAVPDSAAVPDTTSGERPASEERSEGVGAG